MLVKLLQTIIKKEKIFKTQNKDSASSIEINFLFLYINTDDIPMIVAANWEIQANIIMKLDSLYVCNINNSKK